MRFKAPPLSYGSPVPMLPSDVAGSLVVEWRYDKPEKMAVAEVGAILLRARDDGWWGVNHYSIAAGIGALIECGSRRDGTAKRAAILALATHLAEPDLGAVRSLAHREPQPVAPPAPSSGWVPAKGMRVRLLPIVVEEFADDPSVRDSAGLEGVITRLQSDGRWFMVKMDHRATEWGLGIQHVEPVAPSEGKPVEAVVWEGGERGRIGVTHPQSAALWCMAVDRTSRGSFEWMTNGPDLRHRDVWDAHGVCPTLDEAKAAAIAAWKGLQK